MSLPKRVLLLARELHAGGSERQLAETAKALHRAGWTVHVGCFHEAGIRAQELRSLGIPVVRFPVRSFASLSAVQGISAFRQYIRQHNIALTHSFDPPLNLFGTVAARLSAPRVVLSSQRSYRTLLSPARQRLARVTDRLVDGIVVNCGAIRRHLIEDESVASSRIHLCYNGVDTTTFYPSPAPRPDVLAGATAVIAAVAVLRPEKDLLTLVRAFATVRAQRPGVRLLIVGSGPQRQPLEQLAQSLNVAPDIHFESTTQDVARWLNAADIFVLPSLSEAFSNALMEAMACGVTPIASRVGGNPELVREGETGFLFPPGDADALAVQILRLVDDPHLRRSLGTAAASFIRTEMTVAKAGARMAEIYTGLLSTR